MDNKKLKSFVNFVPGINQSRADGRYPNHTIEYYDQSAFEQDFYFDSKVRVEKYADIYYYKSSLRTGDVVISNTKQVASMIGYGNAGKILPMNFTKVEFINDFLDKRYFLYLFNSFKDVQRQKERETQGSGVVQRIPIHSLREILIPLIPLPQQQLIGSSYVEMLLIQNKQRRIADLTELLTKSILEKAIKEEV